jgi:hypothetical protein
MDCVACGSAAVAERPERTAQGYRRFRCRDCGKQYNERSGSLLNHTQYPSDVIALVVLWRLRYRLTLRDLAEMFLVRGIVFRWGGRPPLASASLAGGKIRGAEASSRAAPRTRTSASRIARLFLHGLCGQVFGAEKRINSFTHQG